MSTNPRVVIVGGGGFGRELIGHVTQSHRAGTLPAVGGYLDDGGDVLAAFGHYNVPWLGSIEDYQPRGGDLLALAVGSPRGKRRVVERLKVRGGCFTSVIPPSAITSLTSKIGEGCVFSSFSGPGIDSRIGDFVTVNAYSGIGHDGEVGDYTTISSHVDVLGGAKIGADVFIGSSAVLFANIRVGDGATVGAGCIVYRSVPAGATIYAPPAKRLRTKS